jgi:hypothetical protein
MIAFNRTASIAPGKTSAAIGFAREISAYMKEAYKLDLEVMLPVGGNPQRIAWTARYKDLAALDAVSTKILADKHYWEVIGKSADNFIAGSMRDSIWRVI